MTRHESKDIEWFSLLVQEHKGLVFSIAYSLAGNFDDAEECAQDSFLKAWEKRDQLRDRVQSKAWLSQIARNTTLSSLRSKKNQIIRYSTQLEGAHDKPDEKLSPREKAIATEEFETMHRALQDIPEKYRMPLVLYHFEELSTEDVAKALELSPAAARQRLSRGREMLRVEITDSLKAAFKQRRPGQAFVIGLIAAAGAKSAAVAAMAAAGIGAASSSGTTTAVSTTGLAITSAVIFKIAAVLAVATVATLGALQVFNSPESNATNGAGTEPVVVVNTPPPNHQSESIAALSPDSKDASLGGSDSDHELVNVVQKASSPDPLFTHTKLNGRVINHASGDGIGDVTVSLYEVQEGATNLANPLVRSIHPTLMTCQESLPAIDEVITNADGSFVFEGNLPTHVTVRLCPAETYLYSASTKAKNYELNHNNPDQFIALELTPMEYIRVTAVDAVTDQPIAGYKILSIGTEKPTKIHQADEEGIVHIDQIPMGTILTHFSIQHPDYESLSLVNINPLDGNIRLILKPKHQLELVVVDGNSGAPISDYRYRVLYQTHTGLNPDQQYDDVLVSSNPEPVLLKGFDGKELVVHVIEQNGDGVGALRVGSTEASLIDRSKIDRLVVEVFEQPSVFGSVSLPDGTPVNEALIEIAPRYDQWNHRELPVHPSFEFVPMRTDANGFFQLESVFPGTHELRVTARGMTTREPVNFSVEPQEEKQLDIILDATGQLNVQVAYASGKSFAEGSVNLVRKSDRRSSSATIQTEIDSFGKAQFNNLPDGPWIAELVSDEAVASKKQYNIIISEGGTESILITVAEPVLVTGFVENYTAFRTARFLGNELYVNFVPINGGMHTPIKFDSKMDSYSVKVPPGEYNITLGENTVQYYRDLLGNLSGGALGQVTVPENVSEMKHDITLLSGKLDVYVEQQNQMFERGIIELEQRIGEKIQPSMMIKSISTPSGTFGLVPPGMYRARYKSREGLLTGVSGWQELKADGSTELIVLMDEMKWQPLGNWSPEVFSEQGEALMYRIPSAATGQKLEVMFDWDSGTHGMKINGVQLITNGMAGITNSRKGWAGTEAIGAIYSLPQSGGTIQTLLVDIEMPENGNSYGTVYYRY